MEKSPRVKNVVLDLDRRSQNQSVISVPPAFAIASPSLDLGDAMAKVGGSTPPVEPELSPVSCFCAGSSAAIAASFAQSLAEVYQVDSGTPA
jgi:hypothetical protein